MSPSDVRYITNLVEKYVDAAYAPIEAEIEAAKKRLEAIEERMNALGLPSDESDGAA